jgi:predicted small secreted protein
MKRRMLAAGLAMLAALVFSGCANTRSTAGSEAGKAAAKGTPAEGAAGEAGGLLGGEVQSTVVDYARPRTANRHPAR